MEGFWDKEKQPNFLIIDYGFHNMGMDQIWMPNAGEEFIVARPTATRELAELVKSVISKDEFRLEYSSTRNGSREHWRGRIAEDLPWFYELPDIIGEVEEAGGGELDLQKVYAWAERETRPVQFMRGPMLSAANRRRIWVPCKFLAAAYLSKVPQDWDRISEVTERSEDEDSWEEEEEKEEKKDDRDKEEDSDQENNNGNETRQEMLITSLPHLSKNKDEVYDEHNGGSTA
jgi:hypothetical protein